jgi:hypothetical protein
MDAVINVQRSKDADKSPEADNYVANCANQNLRMADGIHDVAGQVFFVVLSSYSTYMGLLYA